MNLMKNLNRIERIDQLIRMKATGTPRKLSEKIGISQASLYVLLAFMKKLGAPIAYSKDSETYFYKETAENKFEFNRCILMQKKIN